MSKRLIGCLTPGRLSRRGARLSPLLLLMLWASLAHCPDARASSRHPASAQPSLRQQNSSPKVEPEVTPLKLGVPVERELAGGQSHYFQVSLAAGQYAKVKIEQRGIDVTLR